MQLEHPLSFAPTALAIASLGAAASAPSPVSPLTFPVPLLLVWVVIFQCLLRKLQLLTSNVIAVMVRATPPMKAPSSASMATSMGRALLTIASRFAAVWGAALWSGT